VPEVSAIVLAGGKSRRLGIDKALLKLNDERLLTRILDTLCTLSDDLLVVTDDKVELTHLGVRIVPDIHPGLGPLGGIYSGLLAMRYERGLVVGCDMPFLNVHLLRHMILLSQDFDVVIPRIQANTEPLHALYNKACLGAIEDSFSRGRRRIVSFFSQVRVRYVEAGETDAFDPEHWSWFNINTPAELELACKWAKKGGHSIFGSGNRVPRADGCKAGYVA